MRLRKRSLRQARWVSVGARRSFREFIHWVSAGNDKVLVRKRLTLLVVSAFLAATFSHEYPAVMTAAVPLVYLGVCAWWGRWPHEHMTMQAGDFEPPVETFEPPHGAAGENDDALRRFVEQYPGESANRIAERLSRAVSPAVVTEHDVVQALARQGITLPRARPGIGQWTKKLLSRS